VSPASATMSEAMAINNPGEVVGDSQGADGWRPFIYSIGVTTYLPLPSGNAYGRAINDRGQVTGQCPLPGGVHSFRYSPPGIVEDLGTLWPHWHISGGAMGSIPTAMSWRRSCQWGDHMPMQPFILAVSGTIWAR
jgi:hypothetical protein